MPLPAGSLFPFSGRNALSHLRPVLCTPYESGNLRRLATGLLFGYGLTVLLLTSLGWAYQWGFGFGKTLLDP